MKVSKITKDDLFQTNEGRKWKYKPGDRFDFLVIVENTGKRATKRAGLSGGIIFEPVYTVECDCGTVELKTQRYLFENRDKIKCCTKCAPEYSGIHKEVTPEKVIQEIWSKPIWEL